MPKDDLVHSVARKLVANPEAFPEVGPIGGFKDAQRRTLVRLEQAVSDGNTAEVERLVSFVKTWWQMPDGTDPKDYRPSGVMSK